MIAFPANYLAAAAVCSANQDIRYYLNGVFVEATPQETRLVATDGSMAGIVRAPGSSEESVSLIIPSATIKVALSLKRPVLEVTRSAGEWWLSGVPFTPVDGKFPGYRRIVPSDVSGAAAHYNPAFLSRFAKVGKLLGLKGSPIVRQNGEGGALVHFYGFDSFVGVVMPFKPFSAKCPDLGWPMWGGK